MDFTWRQMTLEEYAAFSVSQGTKVVKVGNVWWREVRRFFYRPLLVCRECERDAIKTPGSAKLGGFQHALPAGSRGNSFLNLLMFERPGEYTLHSLNWSKRKQIKIAENEFEIRPVLDAVELDKAYPAYLNFFERTHYDYKSERRDPQKYSAWAGTVFEHPKVLVLGAYRKGELRAISLTQWVEDVLLYSTVFSDTDSLKLHVTGLMLHKVREAAAKVNGLLSIFAGPYKYEGKQGVDDFYLSRGCKLVSKPAHLHINPVMGILLRKFAPEAYAKLRGDLALREMEGVAANGGEGESKADLPGLVKVGAAVGSESHKRDAA